MLTKKGEYFYGTCGKDIWFALDEYTAGAVFDYRLAVCKCGRATFRVDLDGHAGFVIRLCVECEHSHVMIDSSKTVLPAYPEACVCLCGDEEFEVMGAVSRFLDDSAYQSDDARTFHLGLRCVVCGCVDCYAEWNVRWVGYRQWLDLV